MEVLELKKYCLEHAIKASSSTSGIKNLAQDFYDFLSPDQDQGDACALDDAEELQGHAPQQPQKEDALNRQKPEKITKPVKAFEEKSRRVGKTAAANDASAGRVLPATKTKTPMPKVKPPKNVTTKTALKRLTDKQEKALKEIVLMNKSKIACSLTELSRRIDAEPHNVLSHVRGLEKKGYVEKRKSPSNGKNVFIALHDENCNDLTVQGVKDEITGIIKCPTAYATGFGMEASQFEGIA